MDFSVKWKYCNYEYCKQNQKKLTQKIQVGRLPSVSLLLLICSFDQNFFRRNGFSLKWLNDYFEHEYSSSPTSIVQVEVILIDANSSVIRTSIRINCRQTPTVLTITMTSVGLLRRGFVWRFHFPLSPRYWCYIEQRKKYRPISSLPYYFGLFTFNFLVFLNTLSTNDWR